MSRRTKPPVSRATSRIFETFSRHSSREICCPIDDILIEMLRSTPAGTSRSSSHAAVVARCGGVLVEHVFAQLVEGGLDSLGLEPFADAHRVLRPLAGHEATREDRERIHGFLRAGRAPRFVAGRDDRRDAAADPEIAFHAQPARLQGRDQVVEDPVHDGLEEDPLIAVGLEIGFQALELHAQPVRHVADPQRREVGLARLRADRGELVAGVLDQVLAAGFRVAEGLELAHPAPHSSRPRAEGRPRAPLPARGRSRRAVPPAAPPRPAAGSP